MAEKNGNVVPVTLSMCLGLPPGQSIPKQEALTDTKKQAEWLAGRPEKKDLREWYNWSWRLLFRDRAAPPLFEVFTDEESRCLCDLLLAHLTELINRRPDQGGFCSVCGSVTEIACTDCAIDREATIYVCTTGGSGACMKTHENLQCSRPAAKPEETQ